MLRRLCLLLSAVCVTLAASPARSAEEPDLIFKKSTVWKFKALATVDGERAAEAELMAKWALPSAAGAESAASEGDGGGSAA